MARQLWSLIRKELALWLKKPGQWIIVFIVPFLFIWIFTLVFGGSGGTPNVAMYLVNEDAGGAAEAAANALRNAPNLEIETLPDRSEADRQVGAGQRMAAVVIPAGFSEATLTAQGGRIEIIVDPARAEQAAIVSGLVSAAVGPVMIDAEVTRGINQQLGASVQALNPSGEGGQ
ncbi:MAG TPA: ABC transporter permease, partial [Anaerolinea sp.]|nr:ABC transporter permease [Anaerolinea sp.]